MKINLKWSARKNRKSVRFQNDYYYQIELVVEVFFGEKIISRIHEYLQKPKKKNQTRAYTLWSTLSFRPTRYEMFYSLTDLLQTFLWGLVSFSPNNDIIRQTIDEPDHSEKKLNLVKQITLNSGKYNTTLTWISALQSNFFVFLTMTYLFLWYSSSLFFRKNKK